MFWDILSGIIYAFMIIMALSPKNHRRWKFKNGTVQTTFNAFARLFLLLMGIIGLIQTFLY